ncbi:MAG TPA: EAL domain-containing protein [Thermoanaerobaculia bacterium]
MDTTLVIFTSNVAQALGAVVLAMVLVGFYRLYQRPYLLTWAWSWWAFFVSLAGQTAIMLSSMPATSPLRLAMSILTLGAGCWQIALLLFGTYEVIEEKALSRRLQRVTLAALLLVAVAVVLASLLASGYSRFLIRAAPRMLLLGIAFLIASWGVWRSRVRSGRAASMGWRLVAAAFLLYGFHQLHYGVAMFFPSMFDPRTTSYISYLGPFDFLFQALIGIGLVIWLLEDERQRILAASQQIQHLAYHDALTDLPNRNLLIHHLREAIGRAETRRERVAVLFLDLDRFKKVNESLGNRPGDDLLKALADRLRHNLRGTDLIARLTADEFTILLPGIESEAAILRVAEKLLGVIRHPFLLQGREIYLTASVGISRCPEDGTDPEILLKRAELAMVRAKETQRDSFQLYLPAMETRGLEHLSLEADLRKALTADAHGELALFFQPVLDTGRRRVAGVEALLRWFHPTRGLLPPGEFLWLAEVSGLANALDLWVLRTACREIRGWREQGATELYLAVNLSPRSFQQPDLLKHIEAVLAETGLPPSALELEITETLAMQNAEATLAVLKGLKELGVRIAIDDFGTGYSSLSYLTTFPIDTLKVDRSFVHNLGRGRGSEEVAAAVIALALSLEIAVVAEGVESDEQWRWLLGLGCERFQGYLFSQPLPGAECEDVLLQNRLDPKIRSAEQIMTPKQALGS